MVDSIASSLIKKLEQLAEEQAAAASADDELEREFGETVGTQSITWEEYCQYFDSPINSSTSIASITDEVTALWTYIYMQYQ